MTDSCIDDPIDLCFDAAGGATGTLDVDLELSASLTLVGLYIDECVNVYVASDADIYDNVAKATAVSNAIGENTLSETITDTNATDCMSSSSSFSLAAVD